MSDYRLIQNAKLEFCLQIDCEMRYVVENQLYKRAKCQLINVFKSDCFLLWEKSQYEQRNIASNFVFQKQFWLVRYTVWVAERCESSKSRENAKSSATTMATLHETLSD